MEIDLIDMIRDLPGSENLTENELEELDESIKELALILMMLPADNPF